MIFIHKNDSYLEDCNILVRIYYNQSKEQINQRFVGEVLYKPHLGFKHAYFYAADTFAISAAITNELVNHKRSQWRVQISNEIPEETIAEIFDIQFKKHIKEHLIMH